MPDVVELVEFKSVIIAIKGQVFLQEFSNQCVDSIYLNMIFFFLFPKLLFGQINVMSCNLF